MRLFDLRPHHEPESGGGSGGSAGAGGGQQPAAVGDPLAAFNSLMSRSSDAAALARQLFDENYRYRDRIRELERSVPAQGAVVLSAEDAARWQAYSQLGAPDVLQATMRDHQTLKRDLELRDVASVAGYKAGVLRTLAGDLAFEVRDETKDNQPLKAVYVKVDGKDVPLETYATQQWADFLPALKVEQSQQRQVAPPIGSTNPPGSHGQQPPARLDPKNPPKLSSIAWKT